MLNEIRSSNTDTLLVSTSNQTNRQRDMSAILAGPISSVEVQFGVCQKFVLKTSSTERKFLQ